MHGDVYLWRCLGDLFGPGITNRCRDLYPDPFVLPGRPVLGIEPSLPVEGFPCVRYQWRDVVLWSLPPQRYGEGPVEVARACCIVLEVVGAVQHDLLVVGCVQPRVLALLSGDVHPTPVELEHLVLIAEVIGRDLQLPGFGQSILGELCCHVVQVLLTLVVADAVHTLCHRHLVRILLHAACLPYLSAVIISKVKDDVVTWN